MSFSRSKKEASREVLTANRDYFVRTDGNDANDGSANTSGSAFLTLQAAINAVMALDFDFRGDLQVTINIADGTYTATSQTVAGDLINFNPAPDSTAFPNSTFFRAVLIKGNLTTPGNVILKNSTTALRALQVGGFSAFWRIDGVELQQGANFGGGLESRYGGNCVVGTKVRFTTGGNSNGTLVYCDNDSTIRFMNSGAITVSGNCRRWIQCTGYVDCEPDSITFSSTPVYSTGMVYVNEQGVCFVAPITSVTGAISGPLFLVDHAGFLDLNGAGVPTGYTPGTIRGTGLCYDQDGTYHRNPHDISYDAGTKSSGTYTLAGYDGASTWVRYTNGGAHTLSPPSSWGDGDVIRMIVDITNNGSAGIITLSGWERIIGAFDTTNGNKFRCFVESGPLGDTIQIVPLQGAIALNQGYVAKGYNAGTKSSGTFTPDIGNGNFQYAINGGAHTLAAPSASPGDAMSMVLQYTNNGSAGTITPSGFSKTDLTALTTTNGDDFLIFITVINGFSEAIARALQ